MLHLQAYIVNEVQRVGRQLFVKTMKPELLGKLGIISWQLGQVL